jgi:hypothetical protein
MARCKCLIHGDFLENLTGETVIKFPTKAARCYKFSPRENGVRDAKMMPATGRMDFVNKAMRSQRLGSPRLGGRSALSDGA